MLLEFVQTLTEGIRTPHPEDSLFQGSDTALEVVQGMVGAVQNPEQVSIKWDGSPAIIFGRREDGYFTMNYKEYIAMPGGQVTSGQQLYEFFMQHGKNMEVGLKLAHAFNAVGSIVPMGFKGYVQSDLMWTEPLENMAGKYIFKPNPHGVTYTVPVNSPVGKEINGRQVGLAVHSIGSGVEKTSAGTILTGKRTMQGLDGLTGTNQYITVLTGNMGKTFTLKTPVRLQSAAQTAIKKFAALGGDAFLQGLTQSTRDRLQQYYNRKMTGQPVDGNWLQSKLSRPQFAQVIDKKNKPILLALDQAYASIIQLKAALLKELEPQVQGIEQHVAGHPKGEGFVVDSPAGMIKLVDRGVFSTANVQGRQQ